MLESFFQFIGRDDGDNPPSGGRKFGVFALQEGVHQALGLQRGAEFPGPGGTQDGEFLRQGLFHHFREGGGSVGEDQEQVPHQGFHCPGFGAVAFRNAVYHHGVRAEGGECQSPVSEGVPRGRPGGRQPSTPTVTCTGKRAVWVTWASAVSALRKRS